MKVVKPFYLQLNQQNDLNEMSLGMTKSVEDEKTQRLRYLTNVETVNVHSNLNKRLFTGSQVINEFLYNFYGRSASVEEAPDDRE